MSKPTTRVYISFDTGWTGTSPTWVEVTSRVRHDSGIGITAWRSEELSDAPPNSLSLVLRNDDGRFTPGNTSSPYYPNVRRGRRIKVESTTPSGTSVRFTGYIDDWRPRWDAKVDEINNCAVTATSRMGRLGKGVELRSVIEEEILLDRPLAYYTLAEPDGSQAAGNTSYADWLTPLEATGSGTAVVFGSATGPATDGHTAATFAAGGQYLRADLPGAISTSFGVTLECFFLLTPGLATATILSLANSRPASLSLGYNSGSGILATVFDGATTGTTSGYAGYSDGQWHHAAINWDPTAGTLALYVDGILKETKATGALAFSTTIIVAGNFDGSLAHIAAKGGSTMVSAARILDHATAGLTGFVGETPASRITRYAGWISLPPSALSLDTGKVAQLAHIDTGGKTALDVMRTVVTTDGGVLFDARDGTLTFYDRARRYTAATAFTLSVSAGQIIEAPEPVLDDQLQVNDVTATSTDGQRTARATDQASVTDHGWYRRSLDLATNDPAEPLNHASWLASKYAEPVQRISSVEVLLNNLPDALVAALLSATVGTRFTIIGMPANGPGPTLDLFVEGMADVIDGATHRLVIHTSPANLAVAVFTVGDSVLGQVNGSPIAL